MSLNAKQEMFCQEYLKDLNGTQAYIRAGYSAKGAEAGAARLLANVKVSARISELKAKRLAKSEKTAEDVIKRLIQIAFTDNSDLVQIKKVTKRIGGEDGFEYETCEVVPVLTEDLKPEHRAALAEVKQTENGIAIKSHDSVKALELLGRYFGIFERDNKQKTPEVQPMSDTQVEKLIQALRENKTT